MDRTGILFFNRDDNKFKQTKGRDINHAASKIIGPSHEAIKRLGRKLNTNELKVQ